MQVRQLFDAASSTYTYVVYDPARGEAALIDPVLEQVDRDLQVIRELNLRLVAVLDTHVHADHVTGAGELRARTGARTYASAKGAPCVDQPLADGARIDVGGFALQALATPGHTDDSLSYVGPGVVFTGDALLIRGCGRTDFQNGDAATLYASLTERLFALPAETVVYPGHDYRGLTCSTIGEERAHNPRVAGKTQAEFITLMDGLGLPPPKRLLEAVPLNRTCGRAPQAATAWFEQGETSALGYREVPAERWLSSPVTTRLVDVREPDEWNAELGHLEAAELICAADVPAQAASWPRDQEVVLICRSGRRSGVVAEKLVALGFQRVVNAAGGMLALRDAERKAGVRAHAE